MKVICDDKIFSGFPNASFHGVVFDGANRLAASEVAKWRQRAVESIRERAVKPELPAEHSAIKEWRDAFHKFGLKPGKFRSSVEQLYKRALKGDLIETRLPLVNLYCYISLLNMIPAGGYDLSKIEGDITIRLSDTGEAFQAIGEREAMQCKSGVVCYTDEAGIICYGWNYRDAARTCLGDKTGKAIFFADSATNLTRQQAKNAIKDLSEALTASGGKLVSEFCLDEQKREFEVDWTRSLGRPEN